LIEKIQVVNDSLSVDMTTTVELMVPAFEMREALYVMTPVGQGGTCLLLFT
jgi:hypothetical protein